MAQTSHPRKMNVARIGQLSDSSDIVDTRSFVNAEAAATNGSDVLMFGTLVKDNLDGTMARLTAQADKLAGVLVLSDAYEVGTEVDVGNDTAGSPGLKATVVGSVLQRGRIWVMLDETVAAGDPVRYYAKVVSGKRQGAFRTSDPTGTDTVLITSGARFVTGGSAGSYAELEIDVLNLAVTADS